MDDKDINKVNASLVTEMVKTVLLLCIMLP